MIVPTIHIFEVSEGNVKDLVRAENKDVALAKFQNLTTILGKKIDIAKAKVEYLYTVK